MKRIGKLLLMGIILGILLIRPASAENSPVLKIDIQSDKTAYRINEIAKLTITIENTSEQAAIDVDISNILPNGLVYAPQQKQSSFTHAEIPPHTSVQHEVYVKVVDSSGLPRTGDGWPRMPFVLLLAVSGLIGIAALSKKRQASI